MCNIENERIKIIQILSEVAELSPPHVLWNVERLTDLCFDALCVHYGDACPDEVLRERARLFAAWRAAYGRPYPVKACVAANREASPV